MTKDEVIEKIKKLLRMKRGGTAGEIENALAMAAELARKHGINLNSVDPDETKQKIGHESDALKSRLPLEAKYASAILVNFFNVNICLSGRPHSSRPWQMQYMVNFVGTEWDIEVARYVFQFLQGHFRRSWAQRQNRRLKNRLAFLEGMFLGLAHKLRQEREANAPDAAGLILVGKAVELRKEYLAKTWPNSEKQDLKHDDSGATASKLAGIRAGQNTNIRKAMDKPAAPARPALPPQQGQMALL